MFWLEVIGVIAFGICGAMAAMERGADLFGVLFLAVITALGGGVIRDVLLGWFPPRMFTSYAYVAIAVASALLVFLDACIRRERYRQNRDKLDSVVNVFDGIGGGMLRDVLIDAMPKVLRKRIYAVASIVGAIGYYLLLRFGVDQTLSTIIITVLITALRILATVFKWNMPQAKL